MRLQNRVNIPRIMTGVMLGIFSRIALNQLWSSVKLDKIQISIEAVQELNCPNCNIDDYCVLCEPTNVEPHTNKIPAAYKPKGMYEITRWLQFDEKHVYDIINEEPKISLNGHWMEEFRAVTQVALEYVNANEMLGQSWSLVKLHDGYLRRDTLRGTDYLLDIIAKPKHYNNSAQGVERMFRVHLVHPLQPIEQAEQVYIQKNIQAKLKIIIPSKITSPQILTSIENFAKSKPNKNVELILVLFVGRTKDEISKAQIKIQELEQTIKNQPDVTIHVYPVEGLFSYFNGLRHGLLKATESTDVVLAATIDSAFMEQIYYHCKANAIPQKRVYIPIAFGQFNPDIIVKGMPPGKPKDVNKRDHNKFTGYWMHDTFNVMCANQADLVKILTNLRSLGRRTGSSTEELGTQIYNAFLRADFEVISSVEPGLYKTYGVTCSKAELSEKSYKKCRHTKALGLGSKPALGILYINEVLQKKAKV
uniref:Hexosyltransferase n=1 Tax=Ciona savignyi TaxID=51511 RepID=H2YQF0_CIOSA